jgi:hypothetical protein
MCELETFNKNLHGRTINLKLTYWGSFKYYDGRIIVLRT